MPRAKRKPRPKEKVPKEVKSEEQSPQSNSTAMDVTPTITSIAQKRKDYYLITTLLYIPKGLFTVRDKDTFLEEESMPKLFSNERKAKEYMMERAGILKNLMLSEGSYTYVTDEVKDGMPKVIEKKFTPEDLTLQEVEEKTVILGFDKDSLFKADDYWGFLKFHAVTLNGTLPIVYHKSYSNSAVSSPSEH